MSQREIKELTNDPLTSSWNSRHVAGGGRRSGKRGGESPSDLLRQHKAQSSRDCSASSTPVPREKSTGVREASESALLELQDEHVSPTKLAPAGETSAPLSPVLERRTLRRRLDNNTKSSACLQPSKLSHRLPETKSESPTPQEEPKPAESVAVRGRSRELSESSALSTVVSERASDISVFHELVEELVEDDPRTPSYVELMTESEGKPVLAYFHATVHRDIFSSVTT